MVTPSKRRPSSAHPALCRTISLSGSRPGSPVRKAEGISLSGSRPGSPVRKAEGISLSGSRPGSPVRKAEGERNTLGLSFSDTINNGPDFKGTRTKISNSTGKLPRGWVEYETPEGQIFFHNFYSDESSWTRPVEEEEEPEVGKNVPPKKAEHYRPSGRTNMPSCILMIILTFLLFIGLLKSLWISVLKCLGIGPPDPISARMVAKDQQDFLNKLDRSEVYLASPLKPPIEEEAPANCMDPDDDLEFSNLESLEPPSSDNFAQWAPKLASIWGSWLSKPEREKLNRLVKEWSKDQALRWQLDRPQIDVVSYPDPDLIQRCEDAIALRFEEEIEDASRTNTQLHLQCQEAKKTIERERTQHAKIEEELNLELEEAITMGEGVCNELQREQEWCSQYREQAKMAVDEAEVNRHVALNKQRSLEECRRKNCLLAETMNIIAAGVEEENSTREALEIRCEKACLLLEDYRSHHLTRHVFLESDVTMPTSSSSSRLPPRNQQGQKDEEAHSGAHMDMIDEIEPTAAAELKGKPVNKQVVEKAKPGQAVQAKGKPKQRRQTSVR